MASAKIKRRAQRLEESGWYDTSSLSPNSLFSHAFSIRLLCCRADSNGILDERARMNPKLQNKYTVKHHSARLSAESGTNPELLLLAHKHTKNRLHKG